jgi:hypothetical protein
MWQSPESDAAVGPVARGAVDVGLGTNAARTGDRRVVASLPASEEAVDLEEEQERDEPARQESQEQVSKHVATMAGRDRPPPIVRRSTLAEASQRPAAPLVARTVEPRDRVRAIDGVRYISSMIIRVLTATVADRHRHALHELMRQQLPLLREHEGLVYVKLARRLVGREEEVMLFEEWRDPASMYAWTGPNIERPRLLPGAEDLITDLRITHYEALDVDPSAEARVSVVGVDPPPHLGHDFLRLRELLRSNEQVDRAPRDSMMTRFRAGPIRIVRPFPSSNVRTPVFGRKLAPSRTTNSRCWVRTREDPTAGATSSTFSAGSRTTASASRAACGRASSQASPGGVLDIGSRLQVWRALQPGPSVGARAFHCGTVRN